MRRILLLALFALSRADWWDDFSNNLASDLAPVLALFGEQVTKQFLSESTSLLDNLIFAMVPLGILTAVVSAIRVCGGPSLRAFIGRAQEGGGVAEAELCSSTSRDVCELYHNGAVVRVFGRPKILEVVHDPTDATFYSTRSGKRVDRPKCGVYSFQEYMETPVARKAGWMEEGRAVGKDEEEDRNIEVVREVLGPNKFAPNPNLSLNVGIKKHPRGMWAVAMVGVILQGVVLMFGALATYRWRWKKNDALAPGWAFPLMLAGTLLQCAGMFHCAFLVERSTKERFFYRPTPGHGTSSLQIVQPGNQVVGDQTFDSFAFRDVRNPLREYTTSWKDAQEPAAPKTVAFAVGVTLVGFILQFVGLRAMHSAVSVFQLGAIMVMSLLRSMLRTQRLKREQNLLFNRPDQVEGHELDWLALQNDPAKDGKSNSSTYWSIHPFSTPSQIQTASDEDQSTASNEVVESRKDALDNAFVVCRPRHTYTADEKIATAFIDRLKEKECPPGSDLPNRAARLMYYRARLAELTSKQDKGSAQFSNSWGDQIVKARTQAIQLKKAIESSADVIFSRTNLKRDWERAERFAWSLHVHSRGNPPERVYLSLERVSHGPKDYSPWVANQHMLEAAIGLWTWSAISDERVETSDRFGLTVSSAEKFPIERILAAETTQDKLSLADTQLMMWSEDFPRNISNRDCITWPKDCMRSSMVWESPPRGELKPLETPVNGFRVAGPEVRFCGWEAMKHHDEPEAANVRLTTVEIKLPLTVLFAQDIYQSFICSVTEAMDSIGGKLVPSTFRAEFALKNDVISKLVDCFESSGLGTRQDAYTVIIPALRSRGKLPIPLSAIQEILDNAEQYREKGDYEQAEQVLRWLWLATTGMEAELDSPEQPGREQITMDICELYRRWPARHNGARDYPARDGYRFLGDFYDPEDRGTVGNTVRRYLKLASREPCYETDPETTIAAIVNNDRVEALWLAESGPLSPFQDSAGRTILSWAAQRGWIELVKQALQDGHDANAVDNNDRTPLSYAAEYGHDRVITLLLQHHANPVIPDGNSLAPLSYAAIGGFPQAIQALRKDPMADLYTRYRRNESLLYLAAVNGKQNTVEFLLSLTASSMINSPTTTGSTPMIGALIGGHEGIAAMLLERGAQWDVKIEGTEAWLWAVRYGYWACAEFLMACADREQEEPREKRTVIFETCPLLDGDGIKFQSKHLKGRGGVVACQLDSQGGNITVSKQSILSLLGGSCLARARVFGGGDGERSRVRLERYVVEVKLAELLTRQMGAPFHVTEEILIKVVSCPIDGAKERLTALLDWRPEEVQITDPVMKAIIGNTQHWKDILRLLFQRMNHLSISESSLRAAAGSGNMDMVNFFRYERGLDRPDLVDIATLATPGTWRDLGQVEALLRKGVEPDCPNNRGVTPLYMAVRRGYISVVRLLAARPDVNVNVRGMQGRTMLFYLSRFEPPERYEAARLLLDAGADPLMEDDVGMTAMDDARAKGDRELVEMFGGVYETDDGI